MNLEALKKEAALRAIQHVKDGMIVGLGTGSTARYAVDGLAARMREEGISIIGVPTSERTAEQAKKLGIPLATLEEHSSLDVAIDGADEIELSTLHLIKGAGGALLREKLVEVCAKKLIIIADETKKVGSLGQRFPVPVEVVRFGWKGTQERLKALGCAPVQRLNDKGTPYVTDEGNFLLDCRFLEIRDAAALADKIKSLCGVVEHGLFVGMASEAIVATSTGIEVLHPPQ